MNKHKHFTIRLGNIVEDRLGNTVVISNLESRSVMIAKISTEAELLEKINSENKFKHLLQKLIQRAIRSKSLK